MPVEIPASAAIEVVFASEAKSAEAAGLARPLFAIVPDLDSWNDYGFQLFATLHILGLGPDAPSPIRLMFEGQDRTAPFLLQLFRERGDVIRVEDVERPYCSLLSSSISYKDIVERLGFELAVSALRKMGDAVVVRAEGSDTKRLELIDSDAFHVGVMRSSSAFDAYRRGGRHLRRTPAIEVDDAARSFAMGAVLPSAPNPYLLRFDFERDALFNDRVDVLIGRNGVGKTQLLRSVVDGLVDRTSSVRERRVRFLPKPNASRLLVFSSVISDPYPAAIPSWHGIDYEYFSMTAQREAGVDALLASLVSCKRGDHVGSLAIEGEVLQRLDVLEKILQPLDIWDAIFLPLKPAQQGDRLHSTLIWEGARYAALSAPLNELGTIALVQQIDWSRTVVIFKEGHLRQLSSGELAIFRFAAQAVGAIEQGSLLLFDEPETHLHPNYVSYFVEVLQTLLAATNSAAIVATHSAYVVREVPRHRVRVLTRESDGSVW